MDESLNGDLSPRYTLSSSFIVRCDPNYRDKYLLFNISNGDKFRLSNIAFAILKLLDYNVLNFNEIKKYLINLNDELEVGALEQVFTEMARANFLTKSENLLTTSEVESNITKFDNLNIPVTSSPYEIELHPTKGCNLKCKHCAYDSGTKLPNELELGSWYELLDELERLRVLRLIISGGEPLVYTRAKELFNFLRSKRIRVDLLTNGTLIDQELAQILSSSNICTTISLDGAKEPTHNQLRGSNCFYKVLNGLNLLAKTRGNFGISTVVNKQNIGEMEDIVKIGIELGARSVGFILIDPIGRAKYAKDYLLTNKDIVIVSSQVKVLQERYNEKLQVEYLDPSIPNYKDLDISKEYDLIYCTAGTTRMAIRSDGAVFPCVYAFHDDKFLIGNIISETAKEIWAKPKWMTFRGMIRLKDLHICRRCELSRACTLKICRLRAYYQTQDLFAPPSNCPQINIRESVVVRQ